jgi:hypothetical protein
MYGAKIEVTDSLRRWWLDRHSQAESDALAGRLFGEKFEDDEPDEFAAGRFAPPLRPREEERRPRRAVRTGSSRRHCARERCASPWRR